MEAVLIKEKKEFIDFITEDIKENKYTEIKITLKNEENGSENSIELNVENLVKVFQRLSVKGNLSISFSNKDDSSEIKANMKFAGFSSVKLTEKEEENSKHFVLLGVKKEEEKIDEEKNKWKVLESKEITGDKINENDLIDPNNIYQQFAQEQNCMTKPKPCKNCTCGRLEQENGGVKQGQPVKSECGKCYLGDAFRCEGCPYRGMKAFEPGEKIILTNNNDNIGSNLGVSKGEEDKVEVNVKGGKVKLDI